MSAHQSAVELGEDPGSPFVHLRLPLLPGVGPPQLLLAMCFSYLVTGRISRAVGAFIHSSVRVISGIVSSLLPD